MTTKEHIKALELQAKAREGVCDELRQTIDRMRETIQRERRWRQEAEADAGRLRAALREAIEQLQVIEKRATAVVGLAAYDIEHIAAEARKSAQAAALHGCKLRALKQLDAVMAELSGRLREHFESAGHPACPDPQCEYAG